MALDGGAILALKILGMAALAAVLSVLGRIAILKSRYNKQMYEAARSVGGSPVGMRTDVPKTFIIEAPGSAAHHEGPQRLLWLVSSGDLTTISPEDVWALRQQGLLRWYFAPGASGADNVGENTILGIARERPAAHPSIMASYNARQTRYAVMAIVLFVILVTLALLFADELEILRRPALAIASLIAAGI